MTPEELKAKIKQSDGLVLCDGELYLQTADGDTIDTIYPCAREIASLIGDLFEKDVDFE